MENNRVELNRQFCQMLKGGVIMDVTTPEQAKIAEAAGACAVMALERIPADIRAAGGVSRMSDPKMIKGIQQAVSIPVMAKCRIGHFAEAQVLEAIEIDCVDESEVLSPADDRYHIDKTAFRVPFVCGAKDLGEALRRIAEGASMIRTKGEPGTGDVVQAVRHMRKMTGEIARLAALREDELYTAAKELEVPYDLVRYVHEHQKLPVVNFAAGGVATPADAALMMQLGAEGVFVGSGIFKSGQPGEAAAAIVRAVTNYTDAKLIAALSEDLGEAMVGINEQEITLLMAGARQMMRIGVLAVQGAFIEHEHMLRSLGVSCFEIRNREDIAAPFDGLILPGGESTVMGALLRDLELLEPLRERIRQGLRCWHLRGPHSPGRGAAGRGGPPSRHPAARREPQRLWPAAGQLHRYGRGSGRRRLPAGLHPRPRHRPGWGRGRRFSPPWTAAPSGCGIKIKSAWPSTPSCRATRRCIRPSLAMAKR